MPHLPLSETAIKNEIDLKANGEVSRMRSHKGNMPSLPQTKYCALCPAKFTRTTHLNRHLRSHTNERAHRCNICTAEFTRSDLLTRHKRTCGDSSNANRSRRKSCQACAESKVKCNLQQPCSKCAARGRDCVFINDPEASRNRRVAKKASISTSPTDSHFPESPASLHSFAASSPTSSLSLTSHLPDSNPYLVPSSSHNAQLLPGPAFGPVAPSVSDCSSASSSRSSPRLDFYDQRHPPNSMNTGFTPLGLDSELNGFFLNSIDTFMDGSFTSCPPRAQSEEDFTADAWYDTTNQSCAAYGSMGAPVYFQSHCQTDDQDFVNGSASLNRHSAASGKTSFSRHQFSTTIPAGQSAGPLPSSATRNPTTEDLNHYMYLFSTEFSTQIPLFHREIWRTESTHPLLINAMQACGALLMKNQVAMEFIIRTLTSSRDTLMVEFSKPTCTLKDHMGLILAVVLLQSIMAFQPRPDQRTLSRMYHDILIMMIRKTGLIKFVNSWPLPDLSNPHTLENAWKDWARYETYKRALVLAYLQDCSYCMYYSVHPAFLPSELDINLPCDDALWSAQTAREWYQVQRIASPYGTGTARMLGTSMQMALEVLKEPTPALFSFTINPFSAFVLIHGILCDIFTTSQHSGHDLSSMRSRRNTHEIQSALHNWQRIWSDCPDALHFDQQNQSIPFVYNAIPFFWLAGFAHGAKENGELVIGSRGDQLSRGNIDDRFRTVKGWLSQINATLRSGSQMSPNFGYNSSHALGLPNFSHGSPQ